MTQQIDCDGHLVKLAQGGDRYAFMLLVGKYQRRLMRLTSIFLNDPPNAEEIVQDTFITAFRSLSDFGGDAVFSTWLYKIVFSAVRRHWKHHEADLTVKKMGLREGTNSDDAERWTFFSTNSAAPLSGLSRSAFAAAVNTLPLELLATLVLRELEGLSYKEIGEVMTCPVETVRNRAFRAREIIAQSMESDDASLTGFSSVQPDTTSDQL